MQADQFLNLACLCYDDPHYDHRSFHAQARTMLRDNPSLATANIWCAAAAGDASAVERLLDAEPDLVTRPGLHGWVPLLCACYSRVNDTFDVAPLLLDRGADPNAYTMKGNADDRLDQTPRRFTALTGLFGGGSTGVANQPPHPRWRELAELLLQRGAKPDDAEALSINQGACLGLLLRHGLKDEPLLELALERATRTGSADQVQLLLAHGAHSQRTWRIAMERGNLEIARMLEAAGAPVLQLSEVERFVSQCMAGDTTVDRSPDLLARAPKDMVQRAVGTRRTAAVKLVLELGFDPNWMEDNAPLHQAGVLAENEDILDLLLSHGASLKLRDPFYDSTPIGWADFFHYSALRDRLLDEADICLFDALDYGRIDRIPDVLARDPQALERPFAECVSRPPRPQDWHTPLVRMAVCGKTEVVRILQDHGGRLLPPALSRGIRNPVPTHYPALPATGFLTGRSSLRPR